MRATIDRVCIETLVIINNTDRPCGRNVCVITGMLVADEVEGLTA